MILLALYMVAIIGVIYFGQKMMTKGGDGWSFMFAATGAVAVLTAVLSEMTPMLTLIAALVAAAIYIAVARTASTMRRQQQ